MAGKEKSDGVVFALQPLRRQPRLDLRQHDRGGVGEPPEHVVLPDGHRLVAALAGGENRVRAGEDAGAAGLQRVERAVMIECARRRVMELEQVDPIGSQSAQRSLDGSPEIVRRKILAHQQSPESLDQPPPRGRLLRCGHDVGLDPGRQGLRDQPPGPRFRRDDDTIPSASEHFAEESLALTGRIDVGGVEERDPEVEGMLEEPHHVGAGPRTSLSP